MKKTKQRLDLDKYLSQFQPNQITDVICPYCGNTHGTLKPTDDNDVYDSATICPDCTMIFFKVVKLDGTVTTRLMGQANDN